MSDTHRVVPQGWRRLKRRLFLLVAVLPIVANGVVALISASELRNDRQQIDHTLQTILALKDLDELARNSRRELRRYQLFSNPTRLDDFRKAQAKVPAALERARDLVAKEEQPSARSDELVRTIERDSAALAAAAERIERPAGSAAVPSTVADFDHAEAVEAAIAELIQRQDALLEARIDGLSSRNTITFVTVVLGTIGGLALVGIILAMMRRDLHRTEQLAATQSGALLESEQRFRRIFEESPLGILLADAASTRIVQANPAFCRMLGADAADFLGKTLGELAHVDDRELLNEAVHHGSQPDQGVEARYVARSGSIAWASVRLTQLSAADGRPGLLLALTEDITRQKRVEAELRQAQRMEAIGQLTGGIAHDFNNLLGVIIGNVEFLMDAVGDGTQAEMAKEILDSALSGADLTRRLLAFARRQTLQPRRIDLNAYLPNHIAIVRRLLGESISVGPNLADDLWPTRADPSQVGDALLNLAINARDAMPHGGTISIATANAHLDEGDPDGQVVPGDYVVLSVADTGIGMAPDVLERVVEPFFTTKGPGAGSGLGLSMIFGFAKQSGGHLRIESEPGQGTTVRLYLPRAAAAAPTERTESILPLLKGNESILVVDDNTEMRTVARRHLVALGYQVSEAASGPAALEMLRERESFDLLFTDVIMPDGMTGYQLAAAARHLRPSLKVLFTTGYSRTQLEYEAPETSAAGMIRKPYRRQELAVTVRAALEA